MTVKRIAVVAAVTVLLTVAAVGYVRYAAGRSGGATVPAGAVTLRSGPTLLVRSTEDGAGYGHLAQVSLADPAGPRTFGGQTCARVYAAGGVGVCLRPSTEAIGEYEIAVLDGSANPVRAIPMNGVPSRARVSPSGRMISWTVFVTGDSYGGSQFSTRSGMLDTVTGAVVPTLEDFSVTLDGKPYQAADLNFWGVTFTRDDNVFYATMSTAGRTYLVEGDRAAKSVRTLRDNVECPSLAPDGTRLVFKKRVSDDPSRMWRLTVLRLDTMTETDLAERSSVDDQAAWLDDHTVLYGKSRDSRHSDVWELPADGTGQPRILVPNADSPASLR